MSLGCSRILTTRRKRWRSCESSTDATSTGGCSELERIEARLEALTAQPSGPTLLIPGKRICAYFRRSPFRIASLPPP